MSQLVEQAVVLDRLRAAVVAAVVSGARSQFMHPDVSGLARAIALVINGDDYRNAVATAEEVKSAATALYRDIIHGIPDDHGIMPEQLFARHVAEWLRDLLYLDPQS